MLDLLHGNVLLNVLLLTVNLLHTHTHSLPLVTANPYVDIVTPGDTITVNHGVALTFTLRAIALYTVSSGAQEVAAPEDVTISAKNLGIDLNFVSFTANNPYQL